MRDVDVAVIGAGPAGLTAAIRVRWVKSYRCVPCSVEVFDPAPLGGLARLRSARITGPSFHLSGKELVGRFERDLQAMEIPVRPVAVERIGRDGDRFVVGDVRARAVVLATGLRRLSDEARFFGRGVGVAYNGLDALPQLITRLLRRPARRLLVVGNAKTALVADAIAAAAGVPVDFLLDEPALPDARFPGPVRLGRVLGMQGARRLERVRLQVDGTEQIEDVDRVFLDYTAFELRSEAGVEVPGLRRDPARFVAVDRACHTSVPGVFAAGDVTGLYAMVSKGLAEGAVAGFSAYRYVFAQKFGFDPPLFAYAGFDAPVAPDATDYPALHDDDQVVPLVAGAPTGRVAGFDPDPAAARRRVYGLLGDKQVTIQPVAGARGLARRRDVEAPDGARLPQATRRPT